MLFIFQHLIKFNITLGTLNNNTTINPKLAYYIYNKKLNQYLFQFHKLIFKVKKILQIIFNIAKANGSFLFLQKLNDNNIIKYIAQNVASQCVSVPWISGIITNRSTYMISKKKGRRHLIKIKKLPHLIINFNSELNAIKEIKTLRRPIICFSDLNLNPDSIEYNITSNVQSLDALYLYGFLVNKSIKEGRKILFKKKINRILKFFFPAFMY